MKYGYVHRWLVFVIAAASALPLQANPTGGSVAAGSAAIAGEGTSAVTVNQASNLAIINWQTFSIATGQSTTFLQPSASSAALNRVLGGQTSIINGTLTANGQLYLINGNGIVVGPGGVISANAFTASTRDISDADFLAGDLEFVGSNNAGVQNFGAITALGGNVVLIGKTVSNAGTINAPNGTAGLVAGDDVLLAQQNADGSTITVNPDPLATGAAGKVGVKNSGTINAAAAELKAANGNIYALAIQNSGIIRATTVQKQGGHIWLTADSGTVENTGTLNASATVAGGTGGTVTVKSATGTVGDSGAILAEGGPGGAGGDAEISGAVLQYNGTVNLTAPGGVTGDLLLDPDTLEIVASGGTGTIGDLPDTGDSTIDASALDTALDGANITLQANDSISVNAAVNASSANGNTSPGNLTLDAPTLTFNAPVTLYSGSTLSGNATTVNVGTAGLVQNGIDAAAAGGTVNLAATTYDLSSEIVINKNLTLDGSTAGSTILDAQGNSRVMEIDGTEAGDMVNLTDLTLTGGDGAGANESGFGGGLLVYSNGTTATVNITDSTISGNSASVDGGGIYNDGDGDTATVTINNSTISGNSASAGGGIYNFGEGGIANLTITDSTISGNSSGGGGGIFNQAIAGTGPSSTASVTINNSTISGNSASGDGGGIENSITTSVSSSTATVTINNSTISGNTAVTGGGIYNWNGSKHPSDVSATLTIGDTILAGNTSGGVESDYVNGGDGTLDDEGYNLFGNDGVLTAGATGDILFSGNIDTVLAPLGNYGGPTETMALVADSPAIDAGGSNVGGYEVDQRGYARSTTGEISIGAYEYDSAGNPFVITSTADQSGLVIGTLRTALAYASANPLLDPTITFDPADFSTAQTILLTDGELLINASLSIDATSVGGVTLNAQGNSRVMEIDGTASGIIVNLSNLTLTGGDGVDTAGVGAAGSNYDGAGGGLLIYTNGTTATVTISDSTISSNLAGGGGGIWNDAEEGGAATLMINNSTISGNSTYAVGEGGGIVNGSGIMSDDGGSATLTINNSTISGNSSGRDGGGIFNSHANGSGSATVTITDSTISGNSAGNGYPANGGGIFNTGVVTIGDTILAGNTLLDGSESDYDGGTLIDDGYNLFGSGGGYTGSATGDINFSGNIDTVLAPLGNYGGPTETMALVADSPAIDAGNPDSTITTDQRGALRGNADGLNAGSLPDIGAYEASSSYLVDNTLDDGSVGSLVAAISFSNAAGNADFNENPANLSGPTAGAVPVITFSPTVFATPQTITLDGSELLITDSVTIDGPSVGVTINANNASRVMEIDGTVAGDTVNLSNLTLENGNGVDTTGVGAAGGLMGGVLNGITGGGLIIYAYGTTATVTLTGSTISGNTVDGGLGGGGICIFAGTLFAGTMTIDNSTISGNSAGPNGSGGGIYNTGLLTIYDSTISGNSSIGGRVPEGGGIYNGGTLTIDDSTISGNTTSGESNEGGGISNEGTLTIYNSTISGNTISGGPYTDGGGIANFGTMTIGDTILAGNTSGGSESDYSGDGTLTDEGYNLFATGGGITGSATGDINFSGSISSVLAPLGNYGGPTETMALVVGSPAYLAGGPQNGVTTDQRGDARGSVISIGAWDYDPANLSLVVNTNADTADDVIGSALVTLRDAIFYGEVGETAGVFTDPTVTFASSPGQFDGVGTDNTIDLEQGELLINNSLSIDATSVGGVTLDAGGNSRVMEIDGTASGDTVNLSNLTLENGNGAGGSESGLGGGLLVYAGEGETVNATLNDSTISGNTASGSGGGIFNNGYYGSATLTITGSTISGNSVGPGQYGGGIYNSGGGSIVMISDSTISGNSAYDGRLVYGGGIYNDGTMTIYDSTISGNTVSGGGFTDGGGIYNDDGTVMIYDSTISGNTISGGNDGGGGIVNFSTMTIYDSTISGNSTDVNGDGGGILNYGTVTIGDTILAGNTSGGSESDYFNGGGTLNDEGYNLVLQNSGTGFTNGVNNDIVYNGVIGGVLDTTLADNGGPTETLALVAGSPAIAKGGPNVGGYELDQRGYARPANYISIGAYEYNQLGDPFVITSTADQSDLVIGTLRTALDYADANPLLDPTITFNTTSGDGVNFSTPQTITLDGSELLINTSLTLDGPAGGVTINANNASRVMEIDGTASGDTVNLSNLTLENGNGSANIQNGYGGGLLVYTSGTTATVNITDSTISGNTASVSGGGIYSDFATVTISDSTISENTAEYGGGIYNAGGTVMISDSAISGNLVSDGGLVGGIFNNNDGGSATLMISDSTISGNSGGRGGGIYNLGGGGGSATVTITDSTISGNTASGGGGGIYNYDGTLTIGDTILAGNTSNGNESDYVSQYGALTDEGYNLFGSGGGFDGSATGDINFSGSISSVLAPLGNYGGPTETMALVVGSPAYLAGGPQDGVTTDQRGDARGSVISIGAWDYDPTALAMVVSPVVTSNADTLDIIGATPVTLRDAIFYADEGIFGTDPTITFASSLGQFDGDSADNTIDLEQGELLINKSLSIGATSVGGVTINANQQSRVLEIDGTASGDAVTLDNLTLTGGSVSGTALAGDGGGLLVDAAAGNATVTINDSTIEGNSAGNGGGGILNLAGGGNASLTIDNSTFTDNSSLNGGAVANLVVSGNATTTVENSTISGNTASTSGGGIYNALADSGSATVNIGDTILAGNTLTGGGESDYANGGGGTLNDAGYNLYGQNGNAGGFTPGEGIMTDIELAGSISTVLQTTLVDDVVTPELADNGGPTETIALVVGSPAYLAGGLNSGGQVDQRGDARGSVISIGAWDYDPTQFTASSLVVTSAGDTVDVIGSTPVTLRDAIFYGEVGGFTDPTITFNTNPSDGTDFATAQTITLAQGELLVNNSLSIDATSVGGVTLDAQGNSRVMEIDGTAAGDMVNLTDLTLTGGNGAGANESGSGGGLLVFANDATATVNITDSTISGNMATAGGGIYDRGDSGNATLTINNSTISGNMATAGGGIYDRGDSGTARVTITDSTISGNSAGGYGGGIFNFTASVTINNSTISGNMASYGGGIYNNGNEGTATVNIGDTILAGNTDGGESDYANGGGGTLNDEGYNLFGNDGVLTANGVNDVMVAAIGNPGDITSVLAGTESGGVGAWVFTPDLANNGGPTETIALVVGSPAYLAGGSLGTVATDQRGDARGSVISIGAWDYDPTALAMVVSPVVTSNADTLDIIGATPVTLRDAIFYADEGIFGTDPTITFASSLGQFDGDSADNTIDLEQGELLINKSLSIGATSVGGVTINANQQSRVLEIDGTASGDAVTLDNLTLTGGSVSGTALAGDGGGLLVDAAAGNATVTINDSTIEGNSAGNGGGLLVYSNGTTATVNITDSTISGNSASVDGGGIYNFGLSGIANLTITDSTISGNSASVDGGGINNNDALASGASGAAGTASVTINNSTISGNTAGTGGGIYNTIGTSVDSSTATVTINNSTISGNTAGTGGGIYNKNGSKNQSDVSATLTIGDTILAGNTSGGVESDYVNGGDGTLTDEGYNLYGQNNNTGGFAPSTTVAIADTDILLGTGVYVTSVLAGTESENSYVFTPTLADNGGPTETIALVEGSPALGNGSATLDIPGYTLPTTDQRGYSRETGPSDAQVVDIGAYQDQGTSVTASVAATGTLTYGADDTVTVTLTPTAGQDLGTVTLTDTVDSCSVTGTLSLSDGDYVATIALPTDFDAGSLSVRVSPYGHYATATANTLTISPDPITITPNTGQSVIYSTATATGNASLTYTSSAEVGSVPTLTGSLGGYTEGDSVTGGPYNFALGTLSAGSNYSISLVASPATFAVSADPITITPNTGQSVIYSTATATGNAGLTYTSSAEVGSVPTLTGSLGGYTQGDSVAGGPYAFTTGTLNAGSNYSVSLVASPATFTVAVDPITITPNTGQSVIYSTATATGNAGLTYTSSAEVGSVPTLTGSLGGYTQGDSVAGGPYAFTTGTLNAGSNYSVSLVASPATFTVAVDPITITPNTGQSVIYSTATATGNAGLTYTSSAEVGSVPTLTGSLGGYTQGDSVAGGPYAFTTGTLNAGSNYSVSLVASPATFTVAVDPITITPNTGQSVIYSTATATGNAGLTYTSSALVGSVPTLTGSLGGYAEGDSVAGGPYNFALGTLSAGSNYSISLVASPATFTVAVDPITITPNTGQSVIYSTATATGNASLTYTSSAEVGSVPTLTGSLGGYTEGDSVTGGPYNFALGTLSAGSNYSVSLVASPATFAVAADPITITPNTGQSVVYGTATATGNASLTYTSLALVGSTPSLTGNLGGYTQGDSVAGGPYAFTTGTLNAGSNYTFNITPSTFTVSPATLTYVANPATRYVGVANPTFTGTVTGFVDDQNLGDATSGTLTFTSPATPSSLAGSYAIDGSGLTADHGNYIFVQAPGNATALTVAGFPSGQPFEPFSNFSAQFNANAGYNTFFTQSWFPLFDAGWNNWLAPVFSPGNEPHPVYSDHGTSYAGGGKTPGGVIAFGSSFQYMSPGGAH